MTTHAPGIWFVRPNTTSVFANYGGSTNHKVADARQPLFTRECQEANARLIAAAPKLLAALEAATGALHQLVNDSKGHPYAKHCRDIVQGARVAIADAKGE